MSTDENVRHRLNSFEKDVKTFWQDIQMEKDFCDVTIACDDKIIRTHKIIISSFSPILRNILRLTKNQNPLIYLRRVKFRHLKNLLNFMYQGEVDVAKEDLAEFLEVAEDLNVRGLSEGINSTEWDTLQYFTENIDLTQETYLSPKRKRILQNSSMENINLNSLENPIEEFEIVINDNSKTNYFPSLKDKTGEVKKQCTNDNKQYVVSINSNKQYNCETCKKQFSGLRCLDYHIKSVHEGERHPCIQCDYKATKKSSLKVHV